MTIQTHITHRTITVPPDTALILEGGGMRGVYTAGVLRCFADMGMVFPYIVAVSMGACNGSNYVSGQHERNRIVNTRFVHQRRFMSYRRLLGGGELFNTPFIFDTLPNALVPFDMDAFVNSGQRFVIVATDARTGEARYFDKDDVGRDFLTVLRASCALPLVQRPVTFNGDVLMDGGLADSVPIDRSIADGNRRHMLVLTQPQGYRKKPSRLVKLMKIRYPGLTGVARALASRHHQYNASMARIDRLAAEGRALVIRPETPLGIGRADRRRPRLMNGYDRGYNDAARCATAIKAFLDEPTPQRKPV